MSGPVQLSGCQTSEGPNADMLVYIPTLLDKLSVCLLFSCRVIMEAKTVAQWGELNANMLGSSVFTFWCFYAVFS